MTDLSTPSKQTFAEPGSGLSISKSTSEIIHDFILERMPAPGQTLADAAMHHFAAPGKMLRAKMALRAATTRHLSMTTFATATSCVAGVRPSGRSSDAMWR